MSNCSVGWGCHFPIDRLEVYPANELRLAVNCLRVFIPKSVL